MYIINKTENSAITLRLGTMLVTLASGEYCEVPKELEKRVFEKYLNDDFVAIATTEKIRDELLEIFFKNDENKSDEDKDVTETEDKDVTEDESDEESDDEGSKDEDEQTLNKEELLKEFEEIAKADDFEAVKEFAQKLEIRFMPNIRIDTLLDKIHAYIDTL